MGNKNKESILHKQAPIEAQVLIYLAIIIFFVFGILLLASMDNVVDGWFQSRTDMEIEGIEKGGVNDISEN